MAVPGTTDARWAAPDAGSSPPPSPAGGSPGAPDPALVASLATAPVVPRLMPLRPMTVADVLDGAIAVIKAAPRTVMTIAAAVLVPVALLNAFLQRATIADRDVQGLLTAATSTTGTLVDVTLAAVVAAVLAGLSLSIVTAAVARTLASWYAEQPITPATALGSAMRALPALAVAWIVVHVVELLSIGALLIGLLFVAPLFAVTVPALAIERLGPFRAIRRAWQLAATRYWWVLWESLLIGFTALVLTVALSGVALLFRGFDWGWVVDAVVSAGASLVTVPFVAAAATLLYLDLRVRSEGLDLEMAAAAQFESVLPSSLAEGP